MIVSVTRGDLRDEFSMANDAFALSPISARATQPSDEDYDAISEAFMETARGRWFLGEYAKRNRNADTRMVLDAVERIEQGLAAQKQPASDIRLEEVLAGLRMAVEAAKAATSAAFDSFALEENLAPVRKGIRVIREISWRWREIGADGRICDLIDQQLNAIEAGSRHIAAADPRTAMNAAFDLISERLAEFDDGDDAPREAAASSSAAASTPSPDDMPPFVTAQAETVDSDIPLRAQAAEHDQTAAVATMSDQVGEPTGATAEAGREPADEVAKSATDTPVAVTEVADAATEAAETATGIAETATGVAETATEVAETATEVAETAIEAEERRRRPTTSRLAPQTWKPPTPMTTRCST